MTKEREALKLALEFIEKMATHHWTANDVAVVCASIREALAQPDYRAMYLKVRDELAELQQNPPQRPWVGLTDEEIDLLEELYAPPVHPDFVNDADHCLELICHVEAKLKEKNT